MNLEIDEYERARLVLIAYLKLKTEQGDWHAVRDCAVDIELLEAKHTKSLGK